MTRKTQGKKNRVTAVMPTDMSLKKRAHEYNMRAIHYSDGGVRLRGRCAMDFPDVKAANAYLDTLEKTT